MTAEPEVQGTTLAIFGCSVCGKRGRGSTSWCHGRRNVRIEVVPREVAERLAEALEGIAQDVDEGQMRGDARDALAEYRAVFPKAGFDPRAAAARAVVKHEDALRRLSETEEA